MSPLDESAQKANATLQVPRRSSIRARTPSPEKASKLVPDPRSEQFPVLPPDTDRFPPKKGIKSRSLTQAEIAAEVMEPNVVDFIAENLKTSEPPLSLEEQREHNATRRTIRKNSVSFLIARTAIRSAALTSSVPTISVSTVDSVEVRPRAASAAAASTPSVGLHNYAAMRNSLNHLEESDKHKEESEEHKEETVDGL